MPSFKCEDIGMQCAFQAEAPTREALLGTVAEHAKTVHGIDPMPADLMGKVQAAIK